eukprot:TRINITY_DN2604_c0_g1_i1.p1 TRINITY_DN2604_c0_g1~~TRINITY_DN2604_c0_g1_i1.p1  ORF type:complete len:394 (+),score=79.45 TRINITY_DN2604_c0_g1_i1:50-1231(+)
MQPTGSEVWKSRADVLRRYAYSGADNSISNRLFLRHYWDWCMRFVPEWMAPNLVTIIGMIPLVASHFIVASHSPNIDADLPVWVALFSAFGVFFYQTFDNLDGRQARRTGSSSPLGHMFDHCCDCLNITVIGLNTASALQLGAGFWTFLLLWSGGYLPFFFATWEEYHTGTMVLATINGPCEGILLIVAIHLVTAFLGHGFWNQSVPVINDNFALLANLKLKHMIPLIGFFMAFVTILLNIGAVLSHYNKLTKKDQKKKPHPLITLLPFVLFTMVSFVVILVGGRYYDYFNTRVVLWAIEFSFWDMLATLILSHLCHESFPLIHPVVLVLAVTSFNLFLAQPILPVYLIHVAMIFGFFMFCITTYTTVQEMTKILQIKVFRLRRKPNIPKKSE